MREAVSIWEVPDDEEEVAGLDEYGEPDPAYAAALGMVPAPLGRRAVAALLDFALYCLLQVPYWVFALPLFLKLWTGRIGWYGFVNHPNFILAIVMAGVTTVLTLAFCITQTALLGKIGVTFGKGLMGLRAVNVKTLEKPGFWRVTLRALVLWGSSAVVVGPLLFFLSPLFDPQKRGRGWHDQIGQTWLVDVRNGLHPYDKKRMRIARKTVTAAPAPRAKALPSLATEDNEGSHGEYRPGARISAGVLGVARPHAPQRRPAVGLTGLEQPELPSVSDAAVIPGRPMIGGYLASRQEDDQPAEQEASAPGGVAASAAPTPPNFASPPMPMPAPTHPAVPAAPAAPVAPTARPARATPPAAPAPEAPTPTPVPAGFVLTLDNGERITVAGPILIGRMPREVDGVRSLPIPDDSLSVSKTHVGFQPLEHGIEVVDQGSTNGTVVVHGGTEIALRPGEPALALPGDTVRFGDRSVVVGRG